MNSPMITVDLSPSFSPDNCCFIIRELRHWVHTYLGLLRLLDESVPKDQYVKFLYISAILLILKST